MHAWLVCSDVIVGRPCLETVADEVISRDLIHAIVIAPGDVVRVAALLVTIHVIVVTLKWFLPNVSR